MKTGRISIILTFLLIMAMTPLYAEKYAVGIKLCSFSSHPKGSPNAQFMPYKFDAKGIFVYNPGGSLSFEYFIFDDLLSIKLMQGLCGDCALKFLGYSHAGFRVRFLKINRFSMNIGIGPTLIYRQSWYALNGYDISEKIMYGSRLKIGNICSYGTAVKLNVISVYLSAPTYPSASFLPVWT